MGRPNIQQKSVVTFESSSNRRPRNRLHGTPPFGLLATLRLATDLCSQYDDFQNELLRLAQTATMCHALTPREYTQTNLDSDLSLFTTQARSQYPSTQSLPLTLQPDISTCALFPMWHQLSTTRGQSPECQYRHQRHLQRPARWVGQPRLSFFVRLG